MPKALAVTVNHAEIQKITTLQWNILYYLDEKDSYAMEIAQSIGSATHGQVYPPSGTIYPALYKLHKYRYLDRYDDDSEREPRSGTPKKMYTITPRGKHALFLFENQNKKLRACPMPS